MEPITVQKLTVSFEVDLELDYDSFGGKTPDDVAVALQDELNNLLYEASSTVVGVYTHITSVTSND